MKYKKRAVVHPPHRQRLGRRLELKENHGTGPREGKKNVHTRLKTWLKPQSATTHGRRVRRAPQARVVVGPPTPCLDLAMRLGGEGELELARAVEDAVATLLRVGVDVGEPADAAAGDGLEVRAVLVEHIEVCLLLVDGCLRAGAVRALAAVLYGGRPPVLRAQAASAYR